jgi:two-component system chemotaxis response regulator CheB
MIAEKELNSLPKGSFDIVAMGASAGGIPALANILALLPADFPVPIVVVEHVGTGRPSNLALILSRQTKLQVQVGASGLAIHPGTVYVAPPEWHLLVQPDGILALSDRPRIHFVRPSVSVLFESVAAVFQQRAIAVVLTGMGRDGSEGVRAIKRAGGRVIVQDRKTAQAFSMPRAAIETGCYDFVLPVHKIAPALLTLTMVPSGADIFRVVTPLPFYLT